MFADLTRVDGNFQQVDIKINILLDTVHTNICFFTELQRTVAQKTILN